MTKLFNIIDTNESDIKNLNELVYYFELEDDANPAKIVKKKIKAIAIYVAPNVHYIENPSQKFLKEIFENEEIKKYGHNLTEDYIILKQEGITIKNLEFDSMVSAYILNPTAGKYKIENIINEYLELDLEEYLKANNINNEIYNILFIFILFTQSPLSYFLDLLVQ